MPSAPKAETGKVAQLPPKTDPKAQWRAAFDMLLPAVRLAILRFCNEADADVAVVAMHISPPGWGVSF